MKKQWAPRTVACLVFYGYVHLGKSPARFYFACIIKVNYINTAILGCVSKIEEDQSPEGTDERFKVVLMLGQGELGWVQ